MGYLIDAKQGFFDYTRAKDTIRKVKVWNQRVKLSYTFYNHFHPYVQELLEQLNRKSVDGLLDVNFHAGLVDDFFKAFYQPTAASAGDGTVEVQYFPKEIDVSEKGPYANYNWELLFHVPLTLAVHLSKNQRFAEAQRWFHYIFDPTSNDQSVPAPQRFWKFLRFRQETDVRQIDELLRLMSKPADECTAEELEQKELVLSGYEAIRNRPFQPHAVARTRFLAYQYSVLMKYLDNLIAWGDSLFRQDTIETINEATQLYVLAANLLGPKPQRLPRRGAVRPRTYAQLRAGGLDPLGNALVDLEGQFPFNLYFPASEAGDSSEGGPLFGLGRTLYFCIPRNDKLLSYWDVVADRLFKIRHCMNIEGVVRQLPLFEPPIDPGMLVKAAAAGIDISSLVGGLNQPASPVRSTLLVQKALELCAEVRGLGASLLAALEKKDGEHLAVLRQSHEIKIQELMQEVRFLQWKEAEAATEALLKTRQTAVERYRFYQRLLGKKDGDVQENIRFDLTRSRLTEENFDDVYREMVTQYGREIPMENLPQQDLKGGSDPKKQSGAGTQSPIFLKQNEDLDLNVLSPLARDLRVQAVINDGIHSVLALLPTFELNLHYWGLGGQTKLAGGQIIATAGQIISKILTTDASNKDSQAGGAGKTASYERRADDWYLQSNLAARELQQIGRQVIGALIREEITRHEYETQRQQIELAREADAFLREKFTNEELYGWMQGELSKLYYEYYKFAFDIARKAEQTVKRELMRPELDALSFIKFNYWDGGRKGLLSGEALHLDLKRLEMAYLDHNKREFELTRHISLRQLDPLALLTLKATGACEVTLPEWLYDLDCPGHFLRRIKSVGLSIPCVAGPYTSINCTLSLLRSSVRRSSLVGDGYAREGSEDERFVDYVGAIQSIVTSSGQSDSGVFEVNLRDERFLPFEGAGAVSTWKLELPADFRQFDYDTISDVVFHVRYTARQGGELLAKNAIDYHRERMETATESGLLRLFSLRHDFPADWHRFVTGEDDFTTTIEKDHFPYIAQGREIVIGKVELYGVDGTDLVGAAPAGLDPADLNTGLADEGRALLTLIPDGATLVREKNAQVFLLVRYGLL